MATNKNVLYTKQIRISHTDESGERVELTEEVSCLLLWHSTWTIESSDKVIARHFESWQKTEALEAAVDYARARIAEVKIDEVTPAHDDEFPEAGDIRETGR